MLGVPPFFFGFENGLEMALLGTEIIFLAASRNRSHASVPSIMSALAGVFNDSIMAQTSHSLKETVERAAVLIVYLHVNYSK